MIIIIKHLLLYIKFRRKYTVKDLWFFQLVLEKCFKLNLEIVTKKIAAKKSEKIIFVCIRGKNDFAKVSKNLTRYRSENNFVWTKIIIYDMIM